MRPNSPDRIHSFVQRMPAPLHERLREWAREDRRSINEQLNHIVERGLAERDEDERVAA